jgi:hypothetical protein
MGLSPVEWVELVRAQLALLSAQVLVWTRPVGQFVTNGAPSAGTAVAPVPGGDGVVEPAARRIALAVSRAAAFGVFRPLCLVRAVALNRMLESRGFHGSRVCVGVRKHRGRFAAHAWVEYKNQVIGDAEHHVSTFLPLDDLQILRNA